MKITKSRIRNPRRYLYALCPDDQFYIASPLAEADVLKLAVIYGIEAEKPARIPVPFRSATKANSDGKWIPLKHLPKEPRDIEHAYHIVDWHGNDHYGVCFQTRMCYQREHITPTNLAFLIDDGILYSPLMKNTENNMAMVKAAMNIMLEMIGRCEIWTAERVPALPPVEQQEIPWEILRAGTRDQEQWEQYVTRIIERRPKSHQAVIRERHEHLWKQKPEFCVLGTQNFWGYVIYGFPARNLFVFECNELNNATYIFRGDWKAASRLTKTEVLTNRLQEKRLYHTASWYENVTKLIAQSHKEVA